MFIGLISFVTKRLLSDLKKTFEAEARVNNI
jgi:hypothetical protein